MYWRFDAEKFALDQLPPLFRTKGIYALIKCLLAGVSWISRQFASYRSDVARRLAGNGFAANLERYLCDQLGVPAGSVYIRDKETGRVYLHFIDELADNVYVGYADEGDVFYLSSEDPGQLIGEFVVMVPAEIASDANLAVIRKWVEYYRYAGTAYTIEIYE